MILTPAEARDNIQTGFVGKCWDRASDGKMTAFCTLLANVSPKSWLEGAFYGNKALGRETAISEIHTTIIDLILKKFVDCGRDDFEQTVPRNTTRVGS